jgi:F-type H+-transporting ATPase subunit b
MEYEFYAGLSIAIIGVYGVKKLGSGTAKFLGAEVAVSDINYHFLAPHLKLRIFLLEIRRRNERWSRYGHCRSQGQNCGRKIEQDRSLAMKMLFDAVKRENVVLQFEFCLQRSARQSFF